jgi:sugar/nucleoside kinase (ribokinase family)
MFDVITFGSATWDIFLKPKKFKIIESAKNFATAKGLCFNIGSKIDIEEIHFSSGGGGTNTAATFINQGFKTAFCGTVGDDVNGKEVVRDLKKLGVSTKLVLKSKEKPTNYSVILSVGDAKEDRTALAYRGASEFFGDRKMTIDNFKAKWFYIAPLSGRLCGKTEEIIDFAHKNKIKVALNPGNCQLNLSHKKLKKILTKADVLLLNQEEASLVTGISFQKEKEIFKKIDEFCNGIVVMTKGSDGVVVSDGKNLYSAGIIKTKVVDRTGAGDSFGAGFVSGLIRSGGDIEYAIQLGIANSAACLEQWGAKGELLKKNDKFYKVKVRQEACSEDNLCLIKN